MEPDHEYGNGNGASFWTELDSLLVRECPTHSEIDDSLRSYLSLIAHSRGSVIVSEYELGRCAYKLATSPLFDLHADYIRHQFVYSLLQEDDPGTLLGTTSFLLTDARTAERTFEILNEAGAFTRLVDLIGNPKDDEEEGLVGLLMELLYEMARVQKISLDELNNVQDDFVCRLFDRIEQVSQDASDPYHYPVIRVLLVLNEQYMVAAHHPLASKTTLPLTNKVVKALSVHGSKYKTFGENIILLLNREDETSLQLLTLKLLYLLFTTPSTQEYFYTNDLRVLVDILVRNLLDLPEEAAALRHTYLRVLYPLLQHTQLRHPPHYKQAEIRRLLVILGGARILEERDDGSTVSSWAYFEEIDETTKRLVQRCQAVAWLADPDTGPPEGPHSPVPDQGSSEPASPASPSKPHPPAVPAPRKLTKRSSSKTSTLTISQFLTPQLEKARKSSCSMMEIAAHKEKPGVITPSRNPSMKHTLGPSLIQKKEKPPLPQARRSALTRTKIDPAASQSAVAQEQPDQAPSTNPPPPAKVADDTDVPVLVEERNGSERQVTESHHNTKTAPSAPVTAHRQVQPQPQPPQPPQHVSAQSKKPPPAPKARRWGRGKRLKEDDQAGKGRLPGKFDATLPSVQTTINDKHMEPVSTLQDKVRSPALSDHRHLSLGNQEEHQAHKQAVDGVTQTLNRARLVQGVQQQTHELSDAPVIYKNGAALDTIVEKPTILVQQVMPPPPQEQTPASSHTPWPPPPDASQPSSGLERSPFLSDAELDDASEGGDA